MQSQMSLYFHIIVDPINKDESLQGVRKRFSQHLHEYISMNKLKYGLLSRMTSIMVRK